MYFVTLRTRYNSTIIDINSTEILVGIYHSILDDSIVSICLTSPPDPDKYHIIYNIIVFYQPKSADLKLTFLSDRFCKPDYLEKF